MIDGPGGLGWVDTKACTLPMAERPLRLAQLDDLFASSLRSVGSIDETRARLLLQGGAAAERIQRLADEESACYSFFTFEITPMTGELVALNITVPPEHADVLAGLVLQAEKALGEQQ